MRCFRWSISLYADLFSTTTFAVFGVLPLFVGLTIGVAPIIRRQLRQQAEASAVGPELSGETFQAWRQ